MISKGQENNGKQSSSFPAIHRQEFTFQTVLCILGPLSVSDLLSEISVASRN